MPMITFDFVKWLVTRKETWRHLHVRSCHRLKHFQADPGNVKPLIQNRPHTRLLHGEAVLGQR